MLNQIWNDDAAFVVSAELVLIATILVIGLIVGLVEVQSAVVGELNDVGEAVGRLNQSYFYSGFAKYKSVFGRRWGTRFAAFTAGSAFSDRVDACDLNECALACALPTAEAPKGGAFFEGAGYGGGGYHSSVERGASCAPSPGPSCAIEKPVPLKTPKKE